MTPRGKTKGRVAVELWLDEIKARLRSGSRVSRSLPTGGRVHIERALPFLIVYRGPDHADPGTERLITSSASYLSATAPGSGGRGVVRIVDAIAETQVEQFGAFLVLELWSGAPPQADEATPQERLRVEFAVHALEDASSRQVVESLETQLSLVRAPKRKSTVYIESHRRCTAPGLPALMTHKRAIELGCHVYGLEVTPVYRHETTGEVFPYVLRQLREGLTKALRKSLFQFSRTHTTHRPPHFHSLGRRAITKPLWETDGRIAAVCDKFDFLLLVTPVNGAAAWREFRRSKYERAPSFYYRPNPAEPVVLKRELYRAPVERINDPALAQLFREKIEEVDREITMLLDRNTPRFLLGSVQLYGAVEAPLLSLARELLERIAPRSHRSESSSSIGAEEFAERARAEIAYLKTQLPELESSVEIRPDVASVMVSRGQLLVGKDWRVARSRVEALIQHEIGTHVLTYANGKVQPFKQLYSGLAGYESLQEGLAVLAEYLVGGLSRSRLRLLAARVISVDAMVRGADFVETFRLLHRTHEVPVQTSFNVVSRTYRGGGLTKDALYLKGLNELLAYIAGGASIDDLFVGKIGPSHIGIVRELMWRKVLREPPLRPRFMDQVEPLERLATLRGGVSPLELIERKSR